MLSSCSDSVGREYSTSVLSGLRESHELPFRQVHGKLRSNAKKGFQIRR